MRRLRTVPGVTFGELPLKWPEFLHYERANHPMSSIELRLATVRERIAAACTAARRDPAGVTLLAVSKTRPPDEVLAAHAAGQTAFGENQLQDALPKLEATHDLDVRWHFIGPLQSNKSRPVAERFDWVHSIDRVKIAERLSRQRPSDMMPLNVCLQYNVSDEATKSGFAREALEAAADAVSGLPGLQLRGLMAIPAPATDVAGQRAQFAGVREAFQHLCDLGHELDTLSMGMTDDMEAAIAEGATMVRIGTAIFGPRAKR